MNRIAIAAFCVFLAAGCASLHGGGGGKSSEQADAGKIRVYVTTAVSNDLVPSSDQLNRQKTAALMADELKGKNGIALVNESARADVVVDVQSAVSLFVPRTGTRFDDHAVPVDVRAAGQATRLVESGHDRTRTTKNVAKDVYHWIQSNHDKIVGARSPAK